MDLIYLFIFYIKKQRIEIKKLHQKDNLILGFSIGGGIDQDPGQNPFSEDKTDKVSLSVYVWVCVSIRSLWTAVNVTGDGDKTIRLHIISIWQFWAQSFKIKR